MDGEEIKIDDIVARYLTRFEGNLLACGRHSLVSGTQNDMGRSQKLCTNTVTSVPKNPNALKLLICKFT